MIESPAALDKFWIWKNTTGGDVTISKIISTVRGTGPSCTFYLYFGTNFASGGTAVITSGTFTASTSSGVETTSFDNATIPDGNALWIVVNSTGGTISQLAVQIDF